jgi:gamma-glutamylcyclotransferase (GGCT)/AIG2-like uncharacterized protein YtfP
MLYFAYGSNLDFAQMRQRCPSAQFVGIAKLPEYKLDFTRRSRQRECGVSDVVVSPGNAVWGAVYEITEIDFGRLDQTEGFRPGRPTSQNSYNREQCHVWRDGDQNRPLLVWLYLGNPQPTPPLPNQEYKQLLVNGAKFWHLPADYIAELEQIETASTVSGAAHSQ